MMKIMISQPMRGLTDLKIEQDRNRAITVIKQLGAELVNTLFTDEWYSASAMAARGVRQYPVCFLAKSIENMSKCDAVYFIKGWQDARGCVIEHQIALAYGLIIRYEVPPEVSYSEEPRMVIQGAPKC